MESACVCRRRIFYHIRNIRSKEEKNGILFFDDNAGQIQGDIR